MEKNGRYRIKREDFGILMLGYKVMFIDVEVFAMGG